MKRKKRPGRKYPRGKHWIEQRNACFKRAGLFCEISGEHLFREVWRRAVDHVIPERAARRLYPGCDPHCLGNLKCVTPSIHARKTAVEWKIYGGDYIGFVAELRSIGYTQAIIDEALAALKDSVVQP